MGCKTEMNKTSIHLKGTSLRNFGGHIHLSLLVIGLAPFRKQDPVEFILVPDSLAYSLALLTVEQIHSEVSDPHLHRGVALLEILGEKRLELSNTMKRG